MPSKHFSVRGTRLDAAPVLAPGQTASLTISCHALALDASRERRSGAERNGALAIVAMAVREMMKDGALRETHCEHVPLRVLVPEAVSLSRAQGSPARSQARVSDARSQLGSSQHSLLPRQPTPERSASSARHEDPLQAEAADETINLVATGEGGDSWFVDCSEMDLGNVYVQDAEKRVISVQDADAQGCCKGVVSITNPSSLDLDFQVRMLRCSGGSTSEEDAASPTFVVGPAGQEAKAASLLTLTVPARHSRQLQVFLDTSTYDLSGRKECSGELRISKLSPHPSHRADLSSGHSRAVSAYSSTSIPVSCVAGFCRLQIPGNLEQLDMACARGERTKQSIALRNGGCLPATLRLSVEDEEDGLGRPLSLMRGFLDDSLAGPGANGGGALRDEHGVFRVKQRELLLAPGQVTKVSIVFAPKASSGLADPACGWEKLLSDVQMTSALVHKSRLVLRVVEDGGVHYSVPLRGQTSALASTHLPAPAPHISPPGLPLTAALLPRQPRQQAQRPWPAASADEKVQRESLDAPPPGAAADQISSPPQLKGTLGTGVRERGEAHRLRDSLGTATLAMQSPQGKGAAKPPHKRKSALEVTSAAGPVADSPGPWARAEQRRANDNTLLVCHQEPDVRQASVRARADKACGSSEFQGYQVLGSEVLLAEEGTQTSFYGDAASADLRAARNLRAPPAPYLAGGRDDARGRRQALPESRRATVDACKAREAEPLLCSRASAGGILHYTDKGSWEDMHASDEPLHFGMSSSPSVPPSSPRSHAHPCNKNARKRPRERLQDRRAVLQMGSLFPLGRRRTRGRHGSGRRRSVRGARVPADKWRRQRTHPRVFHFLTPGRCCMPAHMLLSALPPSLLSPRSPMGCMGDCRVGDVSVVKVALCNRSRKDAIVTIDVDPARPSAFRVRHHQVPPGAPSRAMWLWFLCVSPLGAVEFVVLQRFLCV